MRKTLCVVAEAGGAELPLLVATSVREVAEWLGKPVGTVKWHFTVKGQKYREECVRNGGTLRLPLKFERVILEDEDD